MIKTTILFGVLVCLRVVVRKLLLVLFESDHTGNFSYGEKAKTTAYWRGCPRVMHGRPKGKIREKQARKRAGDEYYAIREISGKEEE